MAAAEPQPLLPVGIIVENTWLVINELGKGGYGIVFDVLNLETGKREAMKIEPASLVEDAKILLQEAEILEDLTAGGQGNFCQYLRCGSTARFDYLVMTLLGPNLATLRRKQPGKKFSVSTAARVALQCLNCIEALHSFGLVHRDIKPHNFAVNRPEHPNDRAIIVHMIDFGLARYYIDERGIHIPPRQHPGFRGTARYASIAAHEEKELSRQDDLWSLLYSTVEFFVGMLPWSGVNGVERDKSMILTMKKTYNKEEFLLFGCPIELNAWFQIIKGTTDVKVSPNYEGLKGAINDLMHRLNIGMNDLYDWELNAQ